MDFLSNTTPPSTGKYGVKFTTFTQYQTRFSVHPDHVGFVIGGKGATVKKISKDCKCFIKIQDSNHFSGGMPWFLIRGNTSDSICEAYHRLRTIANEADRRLPRMGSNQALVQDTQLHMESVQHKKKKFKVKTQNKAQVVNTPSSPTYRPDSPTYVPHSPPETYEHNFQSPLEQAYSFEKAPQGWVGPFVGKYLKKGPDNFGAGKRFKNFEEAVQKAIELGESCKGITLTKTGYSLRKGELIKGQLVIDSSKHPDTGLASWHKV